MSTMSLENSVDEERMRSWEMYIRSGMLSLKDTMGKEQDDGDHDDHGQSKWRIARTLALLNDIAAIESRGLGRLPSSHQALANSDSIAGREKDVLEGQARERQDRDQMKTIKEELLGIYKSERARLTRKETDAKSPDSEEVIGENLRSTLRRKISEQAKVVSPPAQPDPASLLGAEPAALQEKPEAENRRNTSSQEAAGLSHALQNHREIQDTLSADLVSMAKQLKSNALAFSDHLGNDKSLLEQTQTQLDKAYTNVSTQQNRLGVYSAKAGGTTWLVLISLIVVFFSWSFLFVVIKLT